MEGLITEFILFNSFELFLKLEPFKCSHFDTKSFSTSMDALGVIGSFEDETCTIGYVPQLN